MSLLYSQSFKSVSFYWRWNLKFRPHSSFTLSPATLSLIHYTLVAWPSCWCHTCSVSSCRVLALNVPSTWMPSRQIYIGLAVLLPLDFYPEVSNNLPHTSSTLCSLYQLLFFSMGLITSIHCLFSNVLPNRSFLRAGILSIAFTAISSAYRTVAGMWKMLYIYELIFFFSH